MQRTMIMRNTILGTLLTLALVACGGDDAFVGGGGGGGGGPTDPPPTTVASIMLTTDTPSLASAGSATATITAYVSDASNNLLADVPVQFSASSGSILTTQPLTNDNGVALATLSTMGNPANRDITVTARVGTVEQTLVVPVSGTTLNIQGPDALVSGVPGSYTIMVSASTHTPASGVNADLTAPWAELRAVSVAPVANGRGTVTMSQTAGGTIALQATGAGATATRSVSVSADNFAFTSPTADEPSPI